MTHRRLDDIITKFLFAAAVIICVSIVYDSWDNITLAECFVISVLVLSACMMMGLWIIERDDL